MKKKKNNKKTERDRVCVLTRALWVRRWPALPTENLEKIPTMFSPLSLILNNFKKSFDSLTTVFVSVSKKSSSYYFDRPINVCHIQDDKGRDRGSCNLKRWLLLLGVLGFACIQILCQFFNISFMVLSSGPRGFVALHVKIYFVIFFMRISTVIFYSNSVNLRFFFSKNFKDNI